MKKMIEGLFDSQRHLFEGKDAKLGWAWPLFEGMETFWLTPGEKTHNDAHVRDPMDMKRLMIFVLYALVTVPFSWAGGTSGYQALSGRRAWPNFDLVHGRDRSRRLPRCCRPSSSRPTRPGASPS